MKKLYISFFLLFCAANLLAQVSKTVGTCPKIAFLPPQTQTKDTVSPGT